MSNAAINWALEQRTGSSGERLVLFVLADAANTRGLAWPAQATIAAKAGLSDRHVRTAITGLRKRELITLIGHNRRRLVYHLNYASKPMFEDDVAGTPVPESKRNPSSGDDKRNRNPSSDLYLELSDQKGGTPVPTNPKEPPRDHPRFALRPSFDDPAVATDGRTDEQGRKNGLAPSGQRLARWVDRYVPRIAAGNGYVGVEPTSGGTFMGAERLIREHGARRVLGVIRGMSEERELGDGYYLCWQRDIKSPAEYLAWYLSER
ncbi:MAG: helix-turn-helix domain-containing protein [Chloroflexi bacterium]|nr:helix-turn-helix domain-containing protein [Chloroflexota bacterium]